MLAPFEDRYTLVDSGSLVGYTPVLTIDDNNTWKSRTAKCGGSSYLFYIPQKYYLLETELSVIACWITKYFIRVEIQNDKGIICTKHYHHELVSNEACTIFIFDMICSQLIWWITDNSGTWLCLLQIRLPLESKCYNYQFNFYHVRECIVFWIIS